MWPLDGGSLSLMFHHEWTYAFINLGMGSNATVFNISVTELPLNETGNGTFCFPHVQLPTDLNLQDGQDASIQVVTVGETGSALYNVSFLLSSWGRRSNSVINSVQTSLLAVKQPCCLVISVGTIPALVSSS